ncbi:MAG: hypothetical protein EOO58_03295 [Hymenobacter sp.]|nr:MAG: hypothetical protein EOO58_03295 [Hymenobacter sp.]
MDRHTLQLKQLPNAVGNITTVLVQQSDTISFPLREYIVVKDDVAGIKTDVTSLKMDAADLKTGVTVLKEEQNTINTKLNLILAKL